MFTVALIGPDGAGKSTITKQIVERFPVPVKYLYMGVNLEASSLVLPTTRLILEIKRARGGRPDFTGPPDPEKNHFQSKGGAKRIFRELKTGLRLMNLMAEEWFRQLAVWFYLKRGYIVVFDRHFFTDYYAYDVIKTTKPRPLINRVHGFMLGHLYPKPDLVIFLDAPPEVLFNRKGEGSLRLLERRRQEYLGLRNVFQDFHKIDASQSEEKVFEQVADLIWDYYNARNDSVLKVDWKKWAS